MRFTLLLPFLSLALPSFSSSWVKMEIESTGIYEITYDRLQQLGFNNPQEVGLTGKGGTLPVWHDNNRIIFYGVGPENIAYRDNRFVNDGLDIYSFTRCYFLTDDPSGLRIMTTAEKTAATTVPVSYVESYVYHEQDLYHNATETGRLFWGERLNQGGMPQRSWDIDIPNPHKNFKHNLYCEFYFPYDDEGTISIGTSADSHLVARSLKTSKTSCYRPITISADVELTAGRNAVMIDYDSPTNLSGIANLDYWILNYAVDAPSSEDAFPSVMACPEVSPSSPRRLKLSADNSTIVLDVTDPYNPIFLTPYHDEGDRWADIHSAGRTPIIAVSNSHSHPLTPNSIKQAESGNLSTILRDKSHDGADMLIVAPEWLTAEAEKLADIHRTHDGMKVLTATPREIYNEYSDGQPDPEALRKFATALHNSSETPLRNLLLMGPVRADARGMVTHLNADSILIAYQHKDVNIEKGAYTTLDFYGTPGFDPAKDPETAEIQTGVGTLPFTSVEEAAMYAEKIKDYLTSPFIARTLGTMLWVGGLGDTHLHDQQAVDMAQATKKEWKGNILNSVLAVDAYGNEKARSQFVGLLNEGKSISTYIGHAAPNFFGQDGRFFTSSDAMMLKNKPKTFLVTAGCNSTYTDRGERGISEHMILSIPDGAVGGIVSTRETWSGQNFDMLKILVNQLHAAPEEGTVATIGEIYARCKNKMRSVNELAFILMCDPALTIPVPTYGLSTEISTSSPNGEGIRVTGKILDLNGRHDSTFSGTFCARLNAPAVTLQSEDVVTATVKTKGRKLDVSYEDRMIAMVEGEVHDGYFECQLPTGIPADPYRGQEASIFVTAYDPARRLGASLSTPVLLSAGTEETETENDHSCPTVESLAYDPSENAILLSVSGKTPLASSQVGLRAPFSFSIDGYPQPETTAPVGQTSCTGQTVSRCIPLPDLPEGLHSFNAEICDIKGNITKVHLDFNVGNTLESLKISMDEVALNPNSEHSNTIMLHFPDSPMQKQLIIVDGHGTVRLCKEVKEDHFLWDGLDSNGNPVEAGMCKAFIMETTDSGCGRRFSPPLFIPIV